LWTKWQAEKEQTKEKEQGSPNVEWTGSSAQQKAFDEVKQRLQHQFWHIQSTVSHFASALMQVTMQLELH